MATNYAHALTRFNAEGIDIKADFFTLPLSVLGTIAEIAKESGYRKPKNANGSTSRYFFAAVKRYNSKR